MNRKKKRVLIIAANDMGKSGVPGVFMSIVRNLSDIYIFDIVITRENYYYRDEFLSYGGGIYLIKERNYRNKLKRIWWRLIGNNKYIKNELTSILKNNDYDIIHSFKETDSSIFFKCAKQNNINKRILHINRIYSKFGNPFVNFYSNICRRKTIKLSTNQIAVSNLSGQSFFNNKNFLIIYNTYDENKYHYIENNNDDLVLLQIGTFLPIKNQLFTIDVFNIIKKKISNARLILLGSPYDIGYYNKCIKKIKDYNLNNDISILEANYNQSLLLDDVSYTLLPSTSEGLSLTAIESQACGIHMFASKNVPLEVNIGGITYIELKVCEWVDKILDFYNINKNKRIKYDLSKFSNKCFNNNYKKLYS